MSMRILGYLSTAALAVMFQMNAVQAAPLATAADLTAASEGGLVQTVQHWHHHHHGGWGHHHHHHHGWNWGGWRPRHHHHGHHHHGHHHHHGGHHHHGHHHHF